MQATRVPFMMLALIFLLPRYCSSIQVQTAGISDVQTYFSKTNLTKSFWWIFESEFRLKNSIWKVEEVEISYTNPVLPRNSPDPGALALPDGSGSFLLVSLYSCESRCISYPQVMHWWQRPILHTSWKETLLYHCIFPLTWFVPVFRSRWEIMFRWIGFPRAMCFHLGPGQIGPLKICGHQRSTLSMALLSSTSQAGPVQ